MHRILLVPLAAMLALTHSPLRNPDFEEGKPDGPAPGWFVRAANAYEAEIVSGGCPTRAGIPARPKIFLRFFAAAPHYLPGRMRNQAFQSGESPKNSAIRPTGFGNIVTFSQANSPLESAKPSQISVRLLLFRLFPLLAATGLLVAAEPGFPAHFVGGTLSGVPGNSSARLDLSRGDTLLFRCHGRTIAIAYPKINTIEYGQNVSRRYAEAVLISPIFLFSKSRKHFVTIGYVDPAGTQQALVIRVSKGDIRSVLASLEARTGRRVEFLDDNARRGGQ